MKREPIAGCPCEACTPQGDGFHAPMRMILCVKCGNKRCPHATDHRHACTHSNEPGQKGSSWEQVVSAGEAERHHIDELSIAQIGIDPGEPGRDRTVIIVSTAHGGDADFFRTRAAIEARMKDAGIRVEWADADPALSSNTVTLSLDTLALIHSLPESALTVIPRSTGRQVAQWKQETRGRR